MHNKKQLKVIQDEFKQGITCYATHERFNVNCQKKQCKNWINHAEGNNCVLITAQKGPHTLQVIGQIYDLTRMRICQLEKSIFEKIRENS